MLAERLFYAVGVGARFDVECAREEVILVRREAKPSYVGAGQIQRPLWLGTFLTLVIVSFFVLE